MTLVTRLPERCNHTQRTPGRARDQRADLRRTVELAARGNVTHPPRLSGVDRIREPSSSRVCLLEVIGGNLTGERAHVRGEPAASRGDSGRKKEGENQRLVGATGFSLVSHSIPMATQRGVGGLGLILQNRKPRDLPQATQAGEMAGSAVGSLVFHTLSFTDLGGDILEDKYQSLWATRVLGGMAGFLHRCCQLLHASRLDSNATTPRAPQLRATARPVGPPCSELLRRDAW